MVNVVIKKNKNNEPFYFNVSGHAGYADAGKDIVCAAISVLTITIANKSFFIHRSPALMLMLFPFSFL